MMIGSSGVDAYGVDAYGVDASVAARSQHDRV